MIKVKRAFPGDSVVKNPLPNAGEAGDVGSIPGSGKIPPEKETATHSSVLAWKIPRAEGPGGLQPTGVAEPDMT